MKDSMLAENPFYKYINPQSEYGFDIPDVSMFGMLKISKKSHPEAIAIDYFGKKYTYKLLLKEIEKISHAYYKIGVRKGDIVTVLMANTPEAVISIYALNRLGAVANIVHPLSAQEEIKNYLVSCKCKFLLCIDKCIEKIERISEETYLEKIIVADASCSMPKSLRILYNLKNKYDLPKKEKYILWKNFINNINSGSPEYFPTGKENEELAIILHSGGTTGVPKDIMLSNKNFNAFGIQSVLTLRDVSIGDKILGILPIFHGFGLGVCVHVCFCFGACSVLIPLFDAKKFGSILKKHKPTMLFGVPTLYEALLNAKGIEKLDFSFLKYAVSGGDTLPETLENKVNDFLSEHNSQVRICEGYGMTEGLAALSLSVNEAYKSGTIGKALIGNEMCVVEPDTTKVLGANEDGELCVTGPTVMIGYRNNEEETKKVLRKHSDGKIWLHTGDMASIDENGIVTYKLRIKRMIVSSGYNVYPTYIEKTIEELPEVSKCVAVAIPHSYKKEVAKAFIILEKGYSADSFTLDKIKKYCKKKLSSYSIPYEYEFVKEFSKTPYGKIDYVKLKSQN